MNQEPQLCKKKSAFRQRLRREYIDNIFKQHRNKLAKQQWQAFTNIKPPSPSAIKELTDYKCQGNRNEREYGRLLDYPFLTDGIPYIGKGQGQGEGRVEGFADYGEFEDYMDRLIGLLPKAVFKFVTLLTNNPKLTPEIISYLLGQRKRSMNELIKKFSECTISQFVNYVYIIESLLISLQQGHDNRTSIVQSTSQQITSRTLSLINTNKIMRMDILKAYFDYMVTIGDSIRLLKNLEIVMLADHVKQVFVKYFNEADQHTNHDIFDSVILICNSIISLDTANPSADTYYRSTLLKQSFLHCLLETPKFLQNIILTAISPQTNLQLQHILRFLINLTYTITNAQIIYLYVDSLTVLINCILAQWRIFGNFPIFHLLGLRLVNNLAVMDLCCAEVLAREGVFGRVVDLYGNWILGNSTHNTYEPQNQVFSQFLSTICTYIILLGNYINQDKKEQYRYLQPNIIRNLDELTKTKNIHLILVQSLKQSQIQNWKYQIVPKILQSLLVLCNYQSNNKNLVLHALLKEEELFTRLAIEEAEVEASTNIVALCQAIEEAIEGEKQRIQEMEKMEAEVYERVHDGKERGHKAI